MVYTQMLFALAFDKLFWDTTPGVASLVGSTLILGSAVYVAVQKNNAKGVGKVEDADQERGLVDGIDTDDEEDTNNHGGLADEVDTEAEVQDGGRGPMRGEQELQLSSLRA